MTIYYFFFKDNDQQNSLAAALYTILYQLFSQWPDLLHYILSSWEVKGEERQQEVDKLWRILLIAVSADGSRKTICVLDTLDEYYRIDQRRLIKKLQSFHQYIFSSPQDA